MGATTDDPQKRVNAFIQLVKEANVRQKPLPTRLESLPPRRLFTRDGTLDRRVHRERFGGHRWSTAGRTFVKVSPRYVFAAAFVGFDARRLFCRSDQIICFFECMLSDTQPNRKSAFAPPNPSERRITSDRGQLRCRDVPGMQAERIAWRG